MKTPDWDDERMQAAANAARKAALRALGAGPDVEPAAVPESAHMDLMQLWVGEMLFVLAIGKRPELDLRQAAVMLIDSFIEANGDELREVMRSAQN